MARVITTLALVLRAEAPVLSPFMRIGSDDPVVAEEGRQGFLDSVDLFYLGAARPARGHPPPRSGAGGGLELHGRLQRAGALARAWRRPPEAAGEGDWEQILSDLSQMVTAFLSAARHRLSAPCPGRPDQCGSEIPGRPWGARCVRMPRSRVAMAGRACRVDAGSGAAHDADAPGCGVGHNPIKAESEPCF